MWISCDEKLPRCQERVLLVFEKNNRTTRGENGRFIIEGFLKKRKSYYHEKEDKKNGGSGNVLEWYDFTHRLLCKMSTNGENRISHWSRDYKLP